MVLPWIIDPIFVDHQRVGQGADFNEAIPVAAGAGQARRFETQYGSGPPQADFGDEILKAIATGSGGSGAALILVNDHHERLWPSQGLGTLRKLVLAGCTGRVVSDLDECRLAHVDESGTGQVLVAELGRVESGHHDFSPLETVRNAFSPSGRPSGLRPRWPVACDRHRADSTRESSRTPVERERTVSPYQHLPSHHGCSVVVWGQFTTGRTRASGAAPGLGKPILLAQLVEELQDLTQSLEVQSGEIAFALSR